MRFIRVVCGLLAFTALAGCGGTGQFGSGGQNNGNSSVVLAMMDSPPSLVTILSAEVTLTGATLSPGNISVLSAPVTVELTRLQTDLAYLGTAAKIPAGSYTTLTLTFANPSLTIENDTGAPIAGCADLAVCKFAPTTSTMSAIVPLTSFSIASSSTTGLLIDVNLDTLLNSSLVADFNAATSVFPFTPGGTGAPPVGAEDVVGHVVSPNMSSNTFTLTNAEASYALKVDGTTTFFQFPSCPMPGISCLQANQILSVDIAIQSDGSLLARNIVFEDADSSDVEVEGVITSTNAASDQFSMVVHTVSATGTGLSLGQTATIQYAVSPNPFATDFLHADNNPISLSTSGLLFNTQVDLVTGQEVSIRRHGTLAGGQIQADRVLLRSSRFTGNVQANASNILTIPSPSLISSHNGGDTIQALTYGPTNGPTILFEIGHTIIISNIGLGESISVRGPLFNLNNQRTLAASKVVVQP
ncbi:MAG TPA: DUF4382 domain-containing protein [Verrucomicrobiae bacterium]|nr:DUF4382 domain-containing protein [Verrucomicrobiae bacterium]